MKSGAQLAAELIAMCDRHGVELHTLESFVRVSPSSALTPALGDAIKRLRFELVGLLGSTADVTRLSWVADVAALLDAAGVSRWPIAWRCQLLQDKPQLAKQLTRIEPAIDRHIAAQSAGQGIPGAWVYAFGQYEDLVWRIGCWLDQRTRRS